MTAGRHALLMGINTYPRVEGVDLDGSVNDVIRIGRLLRDRFRFPDDHLLVLTDEEATQDGIRLAFSTLLERVGEDDAVVCFYSGHGSRVADPRRPEGWAESIVPHDSGRGVHPNRDIPDAEIDRWVQQLNARTPHVTLIFDCCHSGSVTRDPFGAKVRGIAAEDRPAEELFPGEPAGGLPPLPRGSPRGLAGFLRGRRQALLLAACRGDEEAGEIRVAEGGGNYSFGALTYFLARALEVAPAGATWRDVFEQVGPAVTGRQPRQHPQIEGGWDRVLFADSELRPAPYLRVVRGEVRGESLEVELDGGAAHGVRVGSRWSVHPAGALRADPATELARVQIESVAALSCLGRVEGEGPARGLAAGQRAFLEVARLMEPGLRLRLAVGDEEGTVLRTAVGRSGLLAEAGEGEPAEVLVRLVSPHRSVGDGDLGPLPRPTWVAAGPGGHLAVRPRPAGDGAVEGLVGDLESLARYRGLLAISDPDPTNPLAGQVSLEVERWSPAAATFLPAEPEPGDGWLAFTEGERADFVIRNRGEEPVWVTLLQFDADGSILRLLPARRHPECSPGGHPLAPGEVLRMEDYYRRDPRFRIWEGLRITLPEGFPWVPEPGREPTSGLFHLKWMVTREPADFEFVEQSPVLGAPLLRDPGPQSHPLLQLARLYARGRGERSLPVVAGTTAPSQGWTTAMRTIAVRRKEAGE